jgi:hypothetical protein
MRQIIWVFLLSSLLFQRCSITEKNSDNMNRKACNEIEKQLEIIYKFVNDSSHEAPFKISHPIYFLIDVTKIDSKYSHSDLGHLQTCTEDYEAWNNWYLQNKENLYWNRKTRTVELQDSVIVSH